MSSPGDLARGRRVKESFERRDIRKLSALAAVLSVNESTLSRWQNGGPIATDSAVRLCRELDVSLDWLLLGRGCMDQHRVSSLLSEEIVCLEHLRRLPPSIRRSVLLLLESMQPS